MIVLLHSWSIKIITQLRAAARPLHLVTRQKDADARENWRIRPFPGDMDYVWRNYILLRTGSTMPGRSGSASYCEQRIDILIDPQVVVQQTGCPVDVTLCPETSAVPVPQPYAKARRDSGSIHSWTVAAIGILRVRQHPGRYALRPTRVELQIAAPKSGCWQSQS